MKKYFFVLCIGALLTGCGGGQDAVDEKKTSLQERNMDAFPARYTLTGKRIMDAKDIPGRVFKFWSVDSVVIFYDHAASNGYYFNVFDKIRYSLLASFGRPGYGPGEGAVPGDAWLDIDRRRIVQHMQEKAMLYAYDLDSAFAQRAKYRPQVDQRAFSDYFVGVSPGKYYALSNFGGDYHEKDNSFLRVIDARTRRTNLKGERFATPGYVSPNVNMMFNLTSAVALRQNNKRMAMAFFRWRRLAFVDVGDDSTTIIVKGSGEPEPQKDAQGKIADGTFAGYSDLNALGDRVFAAPYAEPVYTNGQYTPDNYPRSVQVFDWEGTPLLELQLDAALTNFILDKKQKKLIIWDPTSLNPLVEYDLSAVKELAGSW